MNNLRIVSDKLADQADISPAVRQGAEAVKARAEAVRRVLANPSAPPAIIERAKEDLALLAQEALNLRALL